MSTNGKATPILGKLIEDKARAERYSIIFLRLALGMAFLNGMCIAVWAVRKECGIRNYANYVKYAGEVNSFMPAFAIPFLANAATVAELSFGLLLVLGLWVRVAAYGSAVLLCHVWNRDGNFLRACLAADYSVFSACAGALVVAVYEKRKRAAQN